MERVNKALPTVPAREGKLSSAKKLILKGYAYNSFQI